MIGIVIVAHGGLAKEYLAAVEHVVGKQKSIATIGISAEYDRAFMEPKFATPPITLIPVMGWLW